MTLFAKVLFRRRPFQMYITSQVQALGYAISESEQSRLLHRLFTIARHGGTHIPNRAREATELVAPPFGRPTGEPTSLERNRDSSQFHARRLVPESIEPDVTTTVPTCRPPRRPRPPP